MARLPIRIIGCALHTVPGTHKCGGFDDDARGVDWPDTAILPDTPFRTFDLRHPVFADLQHEGLIFSLQLSMKSPNEMTKFSLFSIPWACHS